MPIASHSPTTPLEKSGSIFLISSSSALAGCYQLFPGPTSSPGQTSPVPSAPPGQMLQLPEHFDGSLLNFSQFIIIILAFEVPKARCRYGLMNAESLNLLSMPLIQPRRLLALFTARAHCWFMFNLFPPGLPGHAQQCCSPASQSQTASLGNQNYRAM